MTLQQPIDFHTLIERETKTFVGRTWLGNQLAQALDADGIRFCVLFGEPGIGKTAFFCRLVGTHTRYLHHFISAQNLDWLSPVAFAQSIAAQIAAHYGAWVLADTDVAPQVSATVDVGSATGSTVIGVLIQQYVSLPVEELVRKLIVRPLQRLAQQGPIVLMIDGIDEAGAYSARPTIRELVVQLQTIDGVTCFARCWASSP